MIINAGQQGADVITTNPLKQGLKPRRTNKNRAIRIVITTNPLKQGLKHWNSKH